MTCHLQSRAVLRQRGAEKAMNAHGIVRHYSRRQNMLWTVIVVLVILWALGIVSGYTFGGFIHLLLIVAIGALLIGIIEGRNPL